MDEHGRIGGDGRDAARQPELTARLDALHARNPDPWGFETRFYEARKRALTLASLPRAAFASGLEVGCSIGVLTAELAGRAERLLAVDVSAHAVAAARVRLAGHRHVRVEQLQVPAAWPPGGFDLVVVSEVGYYLTEQEILALADRILASLEPDGVVVLCHWRHPLEDSALDGDRVHELLRTRTGLAVLAAHCEEDFRLEVLVRPPAVSVARREGLI